jgi:hypothetical protein
MTELRAGALYLPRSRSSGESRALCSRLARTVPVT